MEIDNRRENNWPVIIAFTLTSIILLSGIVISVIQTENLIITPRAILGLIIDNKFLWILIFQVIIQKCSSAADVKYSFIMNVKVFEANSIFFILDIFEFTII